MRLEYRQGLVKFQTDIVGTPVFLQKAAAGSKISLIISPDTTLVTFAHGMGTDYLREEQQTVTEAWQGPFVAGTDYWIYWDINIATGVRTFGHTLFNPVTSFGPPPAPAQGQMWFSTNTFTMSERQGNRWIEVVRVFAAKYESGSVIIPYGLTSQVGLNNPIKAGFLLFDPDNDPIKKFDRFNRGIFHTTETPLAAQTSAQTNFRLESAIVQAPAAEFIPKYHAVAYIEKDKIGLARQTAPEFPAVGISQDDFFVSQRRTFLTVGHIRNRNFNFTQSVNTPLFVGVTGELTSLVPQAISIQQVATVVSPSTIFVDVRPLIHYI